MEEEMDSLFEGMVLFSPTELASVATLPLDQQQSSQSQSQSQSQKGVDDDHDDNNDAVEEDANDNDNLPSPSPSTNGDINNREPLDENLFSDLTLVPVQSDSDPTPPLLSRQISGGGGGGGRKKKRAAGLRVGYGRESSFSNSTYSDSDHPPSTPPLPPPTPSSSTAVVDDQELEATPPATPDDSSQLERIKSQISEKLNGTRDLVASISGSRKDCIRMRRKAALDLNSASALLKDLDSQLQEACDREDFEAAQRISDSLASLDNDRLSLLESLKQAESRCDAVDSQLHLALQSQIAAEQDCASLLRIFAKEAEENADMVLSKARALSLEQMEVWFSSSEELDARKIELDIQSHFVDEARTALGASIDHAIDSDLREKEFLCRKKDTLTAELQQLLLLVKQKEEEIVENDLKIMGVEGSIAHVVSNFQEAQSSIDTKHNNLQAALSELHLQSETLMNKRKEIDELLAVEEGQVAKLRELAKFSEEEAKSYEEVVELRKSLQLSISKSREDKTRLAEAENKLTQDVQALQQEVLAARASLQELSVTKSGIQQNVSSFRQRIFFIDKRLPELESEKKIAAAARNFKEAARIAAEAKSLSLEKDGLQVDLEKASKELEKLEEFIETTVTQLQETEGLILSKEKEVAMARFQSLLLIAGAANAERFAAIELGDTQEANILLAEADAANTEAEKLRTKYDFKEEEFATLPKHFISMVLVSNLDGEQLVKLVGSLDLSAS